MTVKGGTTPACAACKYQRRRCTPTCALAPFFPANQPKMFQNVHRLYGVSNITKLLKDQPGKDQKEDAMKSIIFEAEMRQRYPVHGCTVIICQLRLQLQYLVEELHCVYAQLARCREQMNKQVDEWAPSNLEFGSTSSVVDLAQQQQVIHHKQQLPAVVGSEMPYAVSQFFMNENSGFYAESLDNMAKPLMGLDPCFDMMSNNNLTAIQAQMDALGIQQEPELQSQDYGSMHFNAMADDRQSYVETKEACESCSETSQKDATQSLEHVSQSELRSAAAGFSLTTVN